MSTVLTPPVVRNVTPQAQGVPLADNLVHQLKARGYREGFPPWMDAEARAVDTRVARSMRCPNRACGARLHPRPMHRPAPASLRDHPLVRWYHLVCACPVCGAGEVA